MEIYLIRHGETEHNRLRYYSNEDEDLNENGIKQAERLKERIGELKYDACYCSPLLRARHTAEIIGVKDIIIDDRLREREIRGLNGKPLDYTDREEYWKYYSEIDYGAESMKELFDRIYEFIEEIKDKHERVLIIGHSGVSKAFYGYFNGIPEDGKMLRLGLRNCELKEYEIRKEQYNEKDI